MDKRIDVTTEALTRTLIIWLTAAGQRRPSLLRDLWTRRGEEHDAQRIQHARHELARFLAEQFRTAKWRVVRAETMHDRLFAGVDQVGPGKQ
jgi:hypothetical protein